MKIGHLKESLKKLFKAGISCRTRLSAWLVCFLPLSASLDAFDRVENWGFDQGGGYRMGSFTDEDANLVVTCMASNTDRKFLAVGGALGTNGQQGSIHWKVMDRNYLPTGRG